jgi:hypothetical protein
MSTILHEGVHYEDNILNILMDRRPHNSFLAYRVGEGAFNQDVFIREQKQAQPGDSGCHRIKEAEMLLENCYFTIPRIAQRGCKG